MKGYFEVQRELRETLSKYSEQMIKSKAFVSLAFLECNSVVFSYNLAGVINNTVASCLNSWLAMQEQRYIRDFERLNRRCEKNGIS